MAEIESRDSSDSMFPNEGVMQISDGDSLATVRVVRQQNPIARAVDG